MTAPVASATPTATAKAASAPSQPKPSPALVKDLLLRAGTKIPDIGKEFKYLPKDKSGKPTFVGTPYIKLDATHILRIPQAPSGSTGQPKRYVVGADGKPLLDSKKNPILAKVPDGLVMEVITPAKGKTPASSTFYNLGPAHSSGNTTFYGGLGPQKKPGQTPDPTASDFILKDPTLRSRSGEVWQGTAHGDQKTTYTLGLAPNGMYYLSDDLKTQLGKYGTTYLTRIVPAKKS